MSTTPETPSLPLEAAEERTVAAKPAPTAADVPAPTADAAGEHAALHTDDSHDATSPDSPEVTVAVTTDDTTAADPDPQDAAVDDDEAAPAPARTEQLVREGEIAADFLEGLLDIADLSGDLEVDVEGNRAAVAIVDSEDGAAPRRLVGPGGQVLEALQELTRLAVQAETGERSRLMLDVAGYRADRRSALVRSARQAIADVRESGRRRELEPMTAFERKVVHDEVLAAGLHSESEGVEPSRYVVILPPV